MTPIDLRSDTVTRPTAAMRAAMANAEVGDDVYGEDPTVRALEERVARLLGKEAALFVPSGTMANQLALGSLLTPGDEVLCERGSHMVNYEGGALAALWGAQSNMLDGARGLLTPEQVTAALRGPGHLRDVHAPRQRVLSLEDTHNRGGGTVWPLAQLNAVAQVAHEADLFVHLDGARLWNAHIASGTSLSLRAACADTVSVCLSKGLGAPVGSLLASTLERMEKLRRLRKRLGGGMRQSGILAAAGLYALEHNLTRLAEDHANAKALARLLGDVPGLVCDPTTVETNMVFVGVPPGQAGALVEAARREGVLCSAVGADRIRLVLHLDVPTSAVGQAGASLRRAVDSLRS